MSQGAHGPVAGRCKSLCEFGELLGGAEVLGLPIRVMPAHDLDIIVVFSSVSVLTRDKEHEFTGHPEGQGNEWSTEG